MFLYLHAWSPWEFCKKLDSRYWNSHMHLLLRRISFCMLCLINRYHRTSVTISKSLVKYLSVYSCWQLCSEFDFTQKRFAVVCVFVPLGFSPKHICYSQHSSVRENSTKRRYIKAQVKHPIFLKAEPQESLFLTVIGIFLFLN